MAERVVCSRRGVITALAVVPLVELIHVQPAKADLFGDIGVLLAQLEQQLQLVSNAIATVSNLVKTVENLGHIVQYSKTLIQQAGHGGLTGLLNAAQGFVGIAQGVTSNLQRIDSDAKWWSANIQRLAGPDVSDPQYTIADSLKTRQAIAANDQRILNNAAKMNEAYGRIKNSYDALQGSGDAVKEAMRTDGVVGQVQLLGRQNAHLATISLHEDEMLTLMAQANNAELERMAAERERNRKLVEEAFPHTDRPSTTAPVDLPFELRLGWDR
jgi:hypothetical protein